MDLMSKLLFLCFINSRIRIRPYYSYVYFTRPAGDYQIYHRLGDCFWHPAPAVPGAEWRAGDGNPHAVCQTLRRRRGLCVWLFLHFSLRPRDERDRLLDMDNRLCLRVRGSGRVFFLSETPRKFRELPSL